MEWTQVRKPVKDKKKRSFKTLERISFEKTSLNFLFKTHIEAIELLEEFNSNCHPERICALLRTLLYLQDASKPKVRLGKKKKPSICTNIQFFHHS
jgi:hypothetical protein